MPTSSAASLRWMTTNATTIRSPSWSMPRAKRFLDEGADIRNYTYAKYGRIILQQPDQFAWQIFDSSVTHLLRPEYRARRVTKVTANSIEELADRLKDVNRDALIETIKSYNASITRDVLRSAPTSRSGRRTQGLAMPKSNWAIALENPPFEAYAVTCGITFTFGGLKVTTEAQVVPDTQHRVISGLATRRARCSAACSISITRVRPG